MDRFNEKEDIMAKINDAAAITYMEIICLAIKQLEREIDDFDGKATGDEKQVQEIVANITKPLHEKRELLKTLYRIESGVEYK